MRLDAAGKPHRHLAARFVDSGEVPYFPMLRNAAAAERMSHPLWKRIFVASSVKARAGMANQPHFARSSGGNTLLPMNLCAFFFFSPPARQFRQDPFCRRLGWREKERVFLGGDRRPVSAARPTCSTLGHFVRLFLRLARASGRVLSALAERSLFGHVVLAMWFVVIFRFLPQIMWFLWTVPDYITRWLGVGRPLGKVMQTFLGAIRLHHRRKWSGQLPPSV